MAILSQMGNEHSEVINITNIDKDAPIVTDNSNLITSDIEIKDGYVLTAHPTDIVKAETDNLNKGDVYGKYSNHSYVDYIEVDSDKPYMFTTTSGELDNPRIAFYDRDEHYIGSHFVPTSHHINDNEYVREGIYGILLKDALFTTPESTKYIRISSGTGRDTSKGTPSENWLLHKIDDATLKVNANDEISGVQTITLPDGTDVQEGTVEFNITENKDYEFIATDNVGNITTHTVPVNYLLTPYLFKLNDTNNKPLVGAGISLYRDGVQYSTAESDVNGLVDFGKVPPTGKYTIKQDYAPDGYIVDPDEKDIEVGDSTDPDEFISHPRGEELPATGSMSTVSVNVLITVIIVSIIGVTIKRKRYVK